MGEDTGSASIWVLGIGLALLILALAGETVGAAVVARHRADTAADLGALAGAVHVWEGATIACASAATLVAADGGRLVSCRLDGTDIVVAVTVVPSGPAAAVGSATARARAGPLRG